MRKFNIFTVFLIMLSTLLTVISPRVTALSEMNIKADAGLLVETATEQILFQMNKNARVAAGSVTKVMTLLLAVEAVEDGKVRLTDHVQASEEADKSAAGKKYVQSIAAGETLPLQDLMFCACLAQSSNACNVIAEHIGGSIAAFTDMMNERAKALGCTGTHFRYPDGTADTGQYTTVWDQYLIFREAVAHLLFTRIAGTSTFKTVASNVSPPRIIENSNQMISSSPYYYRFCIAGMTDADSANYSFISYAKDNDMTLIAVVNNTGTVQSDGGKTPDKSYTETIRLFEWAFSGFAWQTLVKKDEIAATVDVARSDSDSSLGLKTSDEITALLPIDLEEDNIQRNILIYGQAEGKQPEAPIHKGDILGEMTVKVDGSALGKVRLVAADNIALDKAGYIKAELSKTLSLLWVQLIICLLLLIIIGYVALVVRDIKKRRDRKRVIAATKSRLITERKKRTDGEQRLDEAKERVKTYK